MRLPRGPCADRPAILQRGALVKAVAALRGARRRAALRAPGAPRGPRSLRAGRGRRTPPTRPSTPRRAHRRRPARAGRYGDRATSRPHHRDGVAGAWRRSRDLRPRPADPSRRPAVVGAASVTRPRAPRAGSPGGAGPRGAQLGCGSRARDCPAASIPAAWFFETPPSSRSPGAGHDAPGTQGAARHPQDAQVGARIAAFRRAKRISHDRDRPAIGVTFQQVQKYEKGANRVAAPPSPPSRRGSRCR